MQTETFMVMTTGGALMCSILCSRSILNLRQAIRETRGMPGGGDVGSERDGDLSTIEFSSTVWDNVPEGRTAEAEADHSEEKLEREQERSVIQ